MNYEVLKTASDELQPSRSSSDVVPPTVLLRHNKIKFTHATQLLWSD